MGSRVHLIMKDESFPQPGKLPDNPTLSVCMIVRDEESMLPRCLQSVKPVADELVIVDTGSKDNTATIAKSFGARVFDFEWCDDFALARNESLQYACGDWILIIDADEELLPASFPHLKSSMRKSTTLQHIIRWDNGPECPSMGYSWVARLFRRHPRLLFSHPYHETIEDNVKRIIDVESSWKVKREPRIVIRHHGYLPAAKRKKDQRGLQIMEAHIRKNPDDAHMLGMLGGLYSELGLYVDAERSFRKAMEMNPHSWMTNYHFALFLEEQGDVDGAIRVTKQWVGNNPPSCAAHNYLGVAYANKVGLKKQQLNLKKP